MWQGEKGFSGMNQVLDTVDELEIVQTSFSGVNCCCCMAKEPCKGAPCCCCQATSEFVVSDPQSGNTLLYAHEESGACERLCCDPCHSLMVKIGPERRTEDGPMTNTFATAERKGCSNCYCVCCFSCCFNCNDNMAVYEGDVQGTPGGLENAPTMKTMMQQPLGGGIFTPTINIEPAEGPCFFGGWTEIFVNSVFKVMQGGEQVATIKHMRPEGCCEMLMAFMTPLDRYKVTFNKKLPGDAKSNIVLSSILVDYMFFEKDEGPCQTDCRTKVVCTLCFFNCCGCLCPCQCTFKKGDKENED